MKKPIKTYKDLVEERGRLENLLAVQKQRIYDDWSAVKAELSPVTTVFGIAKKVLKPSPNNPALNTVLTMISNLFLKNFVLAKAGFLTRMAVPLLLKNFTSHVVAEKANLALGRLERIFKRVKRRREAREAASSEMPEG